MVGRIATMIQDYKLEIHEIPEFALEQNSQ